jgi:DNA-binding GntR family transcriptional regulator
MPIDLDAESIDRALSAPPKYKQLADLLRAAIEDGRLQPGEEIPGETPLGKMVGIDRLTARSAITELVNEGLLDRRHGAVTRVVEEPMTRMTFDLPGSEKRAAQETARRRGDLLPEVLRSALRRYVQRHRH